MTMTKKREVWVFIEQEGGNIAVVSLELLTKARELADELDTRVRSRYLVINNVTGELPEAFAERVLRLPIPLLGTVPHDPVVTEYDLLGKPLIGLDGDSPVSRSVRGLLDTVLEAL